MTALKGGLSSPRLSLIAVLLLAATACAQKPVAAVVSPTPSAIPSSSPVAAGSPSPSAIPIPGASGVECVARPTGAPMVLLGQDLYEVDNPVHARLLCRFANTVAHLFTSDTFEYVRPNGAGTQVVLHSIGSGNESVILTLPAPFALLSGPFGRAGAWTLDGGAAATAVQATDSAGNAQVQVWLYSDASAHMLYAFQMPLTDCICRFGLPKPTLAFSPDNQYLVSGWPIGKGATPLEIFRVSDRQLVQSLDSSLDGAFWSQTGHRLYATSRNVLPQTWTPETGPETLPGASAWPFAAGLSPDGGEVAYTASADPPTPANLRVYAYDVATHQTRLLTAQMRSQAVFVKDGWVWYFEEVPCDNCAGQSQPSGKVFAMQLSAGAETPVAFTPGDEPRDLWPGEFYPNT